MFRLLFCFEMVGPWSLLSDTPHTHVNTQIPPLYILFVYSFMSCIRQREKGMGGKKRQRQRERERGRGGERDYPVFVKSCIQVCNVNSSLSTLIDTVVSKTIPFIFQVYGTQTLIPTTLSGVSFVKSPPSTFFP